VWKKGGVEGDWLRERRKVFLPVHKPKKKKTLLGRMKEEGLVIRCGGVVHRGKKKNIEF